MLQSSSLSIAVMGDTNHLEDRLTTLFQTNELTIIFKTYQNYPVSEAILADILLFDGLPQAKHGLHSSHFPRSLERILLTDLTDFSIKMDGLFTAVWPLTCSDEFLTLWYKQLVHSVCCQKELEINQAYLNTLINSVPDLIWFKDLRGSHLKVNEAFGHAVGKTKSQCEGRGHYYIWDLQPDDYANGEYVCLETEEEVIRRRETCLFDEKVLSKNGLRQFKTYKSPLFNKWGDMFGTVGIAKDVTDLQNISRELSLVLSSIPLATLIGDVDGHIVFFNEKFCEYFGVSEQQVQGMAYRSICRELLGLSPEELDRQDMTEISVNSGDSHRTLQVQQQTLKDIFGNHFGYFLLGLDVTTENELKQKIIQSANTDFLTGLYNRRYFYQRIAEFSPSTPLSLVYFDLDNFKLVNDHYGHRAGDEVLILMANELRATFEKQLITRMGGDEFIVVFFDGIDIKSLTQQVNIFIDKLANALHNNPHYSFLSLSAGISVGTTSAPGLDTLIVSADEALYEAKSKGKGQYAIYVPSHMEQI